MSADLFDSRTSGIPSMDPAFSHMTVSRSGRVRAKKNHLRIATYMDTSDYYTDASDSDERRNCKSIEMLRTSSNAENLVPLSQYRKSFDNVMESSNHEEAQRRISLPSEKPFVNNILNGTHLMTSRKRNSGCDGLDPAALQRSPNICNGNEDYSLQEVRSKIAKYQLDNDESTTEASHRITQKNATNQEPQNLPALPTARKSLVSKLSLKTSKKIPSDNDDKSPEFSLDDLLKSKAALQAFREFLRSEYSEENLDFWLECEQYKLLKGAKLERAALKIFAQYMSRTALREINIDSEIRSRTQERLKHPNKECFIEAQNCIYTLMRSDSFRRFIASERYQKISESNDGFRLSLKRVSTKKK